MGTVDLYFWEGFSRWLFLLLLLLLRGCPSTSKVRSLFHLPLSLQVRLEPENGVAPSCEGAKAWAHPRGAHHRLESPKWRWDYQNGP